MGNAFANGSGVEQSDVNAVKFYEAGAEAGDPSSKFTLGVWYSKGRGGLNVDLEKAFQLQLQAAEQGHPLAMFNIGVYYMGGKMVEQDLNLAAEWFQKAASLNLAAAAVNLSTMYRTGTGVPKDLEKARNLLLPHIGDDVCRDILSLIDNEIAGQ